MESHHAQIATVEEKVRLLQTQLHQAQSELRRLKESVADSPDDLAARHELAADLQMSMDEYKRYGRQLIMPQVGIKGQLNIKTRSVLIVGGGGLGCPAAAYLAGAGVGTIGIVDGDVVETSNLHRQILHSDLTVGLYKTDSIARFINSSNPNVKTQSHTFHLNPSNAVSLVSSYDIILDCTDMPASRYLISDACVLAGKPLVSGSALRTDGQLLVLNDPPLPPGCHLGGPCYRCVWPNPPPSETVMSCGEAGILGPVVGTIGVLMALEAIKLLVKDDNPQAESLGQIPSQENQRTSGPHANLLVFSALSPQQFRSVKLRGRRRECKVCSNTAVIDRRSLESGSLDYELFCGRRADINVLASDERILPNDLAERYSRERPLILDVRDTVEWQVFSFPGSINIPWADLSKKMDAFGQPHTELSKLRDSDAPIVTICRLGNDSQLAVRALQNLGFSNQGRRRICHVEGGWTRWRRDVPGLWPEY